MAQRSRKFKHNHVCAICAERPWNFWPIEALLVVQSLNVVEFRERAMRGKTLVVLSAVAILGVGSTAMAKGGMGMGMHGHGHFHNHFHFANHFHFRNQFLRNQALLNGWGWGGGWGWGDYGNNGTSNTTVIVFPQAKPQAADVTGSIAPDPCHFESDTFNVPSAAGGTRAVEVVACR